MRRFWLLFAQTVTIALGLYFVAAALRPDWVGRQPAPQLQATSPASPVAVRVTASTPGNGTPVGSYSSMVPVMDPPIPWI